MTLAQWERLGRAVDLSAAYVPLTATNGNEVVAVECPTCLEVNHLCRWQDGPGRNGVRGGWSCFMCESHIPSAEERC